MYLVESSDQLMQLSLQSCLVMYAIISTHRNRLEFRVIRDQIRLTVETRVFSKILIYFICNNETCPRFAKKAPYIRSTRVLNRKITEPFGVKFQIVITNLCKLTMCFEQNYRHHTYVCRALHRVNLLQNNTSAQ